MLLQIPSTWDDQVHVAVAVAVNVALNDAVNLNVNELNVTDFADASNRSLF